MSLFTIKSIFKYFLPAVLCLPATCVFSQITVTQNDFANSGDVVPMSTSNAFQAINYAATGANYTWNFSGLNYTGQRIDSFLSVNQTSPIYSLYFSDIFINPYRSNIAITQPDALFSTLTATLAGLFPSNSPLPIVASDIYSFYYKSAAEYSQPGMGVDINGIALPVPFTHSDIVYQFPLQYENTDSSNSGYSLYLPALAYFGHQQKRTNLVDGWGTLTTPYGTFPVLRVLSEITGTDTIYIDSLQQGVSIPLPVMREYKWIGNGQEEPLLQINTSAVNSVQLITGIFYRDSVHVNESGIVNNTGSNLSMNVYPNPSNGRFVVSFPADAGDGIISVYDMTGRTMQSGKVNSNPEIIDAGNWAKGIYCITLLSNGLKSTAKLVIQ